MRTMSSVLVSSTILLFGCSASAPSKVSYDDCKNAGGGDTVATCLRSVPFTSCETIVDGEEQLGCYFGLFEARMQQIKQPSECRSMGQIHPKGGRPLDLESGCYRELAERSGDARICSEDKTDAQSACYEAVAMKTKSPSPCEQVPEGRTDKNSRDMCFRNAALSASDISLCDLIKADRVKDECYFVLVSAKDPTICNKIKDAQAKGECQSRAVEFSLDTNVCDSLEMPPQLLLQTKSRCYISIARGKKDPLFCERITEEENFPHVYRDQCYSQIAAFMKDETICKKVVDVHMQENCELGVKQAIGHN